MNRLAVILGAVGLSLLAAALVISRTARREPVPVAATTPPRAAGSRPATASLPSPPRAVEPPATPTPTRTPITRAPAAKSGSARSALAPAAAIDTATLTVVSDVPGAQVFLDRKFVGATPAHAADVPPGSHQLNVSAPGFEAYVETIDVTPGAREIAIRFREVRLDTSIEVVHTHRMGFCRGRLLATPQGLRYETTDKDDGFTAALPELETFQVDYLAKNLRIQPRRGRQYDFTDPEGNADRLFVLHRDVERARERLKKGEG